MRIIQTKSPDDFKNIKPLELYDLWFHKALTDRQIAKMYGITKNDVKQKRKEFKYTIWRCAILSVAGGTKYKKVKEKK